MIDFFTRMAVPVIFWIAFGFFIGCSSSSPDKTEPVGEQELSRTQLEERIERIEEQLEKDRSDPALLFEKGALLRQLAAGFEDPSDRTSLYGELRETLRRADTGFRRDENRGGRDKVNELFNVTWSNEHNSGVRFMQKDSSGADSDIRRAVEHFNNATVIIPDSAISYEMQARAWYKLDQPDNAISTLNRARRHIDPLPSSLLEQLAFLYMENGDRKRAVTLYEQAQSISDQNLNLLHGLANAYISENEHRKAVEVLELLVQNKPESVVYGQSLGTELYHMASGKIDTAIVRYKNGSGEEDELLREADSLFSNAENRFEESLSVNPDDYELERSLAYFYQNSASRYQKLLPYLPEENEKLIREKIQHYLRSSIPLFLKLAEQNPRENNFLQRLHQIYIYLGMDDKASETKEKLNQLN